MATDPLAQSLRTLFSPAPSYPWPADMPPPSRAEIEALVEGLIDYLDRTDGDPDIEDDSDAEPAMAAFVGGEAQTRWAGFQGVAA